MKDPRNSKIHYGEERQSPIPTSFYLTKKETKMSYGDLVQKNGTIFFNDIPVVEIRGIVIVNRCPIIVVNETPDNWALRCSELGDFELHISSGQEFISCKEKDMQIFIDFEYGGREILLALDTRLYERGCFINKGPKAADQIGILYDMIIKYFFEICTNSNREQKDILPSIELNDTQEDSNTERGINYEKLW